MKSSKLIRAIALTVCGAMGVSILPLAACADGASKKDSIVIMTEDLSGLFNPFYATSGTDMDVVGLTQIGMLSTDSQGQPEAGEDKATVALDFDVDEQGSQTVYTFVIKNDLKFSDGVPLTMNDVMFNIYEYLDPVYTGSSTMYSIDIQGLSDYRTQIRGSGDSQAESISTRANALARARRQELIRIFYMAGGGLNESSYYVTKEDFDDYVDTEITSVENISSGYRDAIATDAEQAEMTIDDWRKQIKADYAYVSETYMEELEADRIAANESYDTTTAPYKDWASRIEGDENEVFRFLLYEGYITPKYEQILGQDNLEKILSFDNESLASQYDTVEQAQTRIHEDRMLASFDQLLTVYGTAGTTLTRFAADATTVLLYQNVTEGELNVPSISGVKSLGHDTDTSEVTIEGTTYAVAHEHNEDGTPKNADEYDVLQITINGVDPKAIYNFGFTVAPVHIYGNGDEVDIANDNFGVTFGDSDFQANVIQSFDNVNIPVGAGPYMATDVNNSDNPEANGFWSNNVVYYKANKNFMFEVKTEKLRMQITSSSDAIDKLASGELDYAVPQFTKVNADRLTKMEKEGTAATMSSWQLGYGYIGINAGKVPNINVRRAIMAALNPNLATSFYQTGTCITINWPMSKTSWAYPFSSWTSDDIARSEKANPKDYIRYTTDAAAKTTIQKYMNAAGVKAGDPELEITFTVAGASITEHPCYAVFINAAELLNGLGWKVTLRADSQALTKLATGSLEVWAAAWGSTIDPDMYQVYHMNSTASSTYAWGYREIKENTTLYSTEYSIIRELSGIIDDAREITDQTTRRALYEDAMELVSELAVERPIYQRQELYAYNPKTVTGFTTAVNPYSSPLEKVWELELIA